MAQAVESVNYGTEIGRSRGIDRKLHTHTSTQHFSRLNTDTLMYTLGLLTLYSRNSDDSKSKVTITQLVTSHVSRRPSEEGHEVYILQISSHITQVIV